MSKIKPKVTKPKTSNGVAMFRLTRRYTTFDNVTEIYQQHFNTFDQVYRSLINLIITGNDYTFKRHCIIISHDNGSVLSVELHNQLKPCVIPISEVLFGCGGK